MRPSELPAPDPDALAGSHALLERIHAELRAHGNWISFARYMEMALYEPGLGYYAAGSAKLGPGGDFVTAPELGPLYAQSLAAQVAELLERTGGSILELGAGSGALAEGLLAELARAGADAPAYSIVEPSAELRERQRRRIGAGVTWLDRLPERFRGVMLANEVADALPVHAIAWTKSGILERGVREHEGELAWADRAASGAVAAAAHAIEVDVPPSGRYESEIGLAAQAWIATLAERLEAGALLVFDYGFTRREYYHPQRSMGTLMCHYRHRALGDVFLHPGLQDVTAHVDFTALAEAGTQAGCELLGYAAQAQFLVNCGITDVLSRLDAQDAARYAPRAAEAQMLLSPAEMGELFKVIAFGRGISQPLLGFSRGDRVHTL
ncbi:MAG: SAM-dependent methyltransferase [Betaproteobacteria bacterium]|nr:SAM-dependent methyltransferase [Betaproteobacteria bacterium]